MAAADASRLKRSAQAAVRLALQLLGDGLIDEAETLRRVFLTTWRRYCGRHCSRNSSMAAKLLAIRAAWPARASRQGAGLTEVDAAIEAADRGEDVILVRNHTESLRHPRHAGRAGHRRHANWRCHQPTPPWSAANWAWWPSSARGLALPHSLRGKVALFVCNQR